MKLKKKILRTIRRYSGLMLTAALLLTSSCRQEEDSVFIGEDPRAIQANSTLANLLQQTSLFDGSADNILDNASCIALKLPVTATVNGQQVVINTPEDYLVVEAIFDAFTDDEDTLVLDFPITAVQADFTEVVLADANALAALAQGCGGENQPDDDLECADILYPVSVSIFSPSQELIDVEILEDDEDLYDLIEDLNEGDIIATIQFPVTVLLADGSRVDAGNLEQLEAILQSAVGTCDEDDDNDYNDDDCDSCTTEALAEVLTSCSTWTVDDLELSGIELEDNYAGLVFEFLADGTVSAGSSTQSYTGTWEASGTGNAIQVTLEITGLEDFSGVWMLHEIEQGSELEVDLRRNNGDRLEFEGTCSTGGSGDDGSGDDDDGTDTLSPVFTSGSWAVFSYLDEGADATATFAAYTFTFMPDGTVQADNGSIVTGTWSTTNGGTELTLDFGANPPLDEFNDSWDVLQFTDTRVELRDVSGDGSTDDLIFNKL